MAKSLRACCCWGCLWVRCEVGYQNLIDIADQYKAILKSPVPTVLFQNFGDSSLDFEIAFSLKNSFKAVPIQSDIRFSIYDAFEKHNIEIPFPQRVVYSK